jgi:hypothetical protein
MSNYKLKFEIETRGVASGESDSANLVIQAMAMNDAMEWTECTDYLKTGTLSALFVFAHDFRSFIFSKVSKSLLQDDVERGERAVHYAECCQTFGKREVDKALHMASVSGVDGAIVLLEDEGIYDAADALRQIFMS